MQAENNNLVTKGIVLVLIAYISFTFADSSAKWVLLAGVPALQLVFVRYCIQGVISSVEMSIRGVHRAEIHQNLKWLLLRGLSIALATILNFVALKYLSLSMYSAIMFSAPIYVCLLAWPMLGERVGPWRWLAIGIGFIGVLIIVRPFDTDFHWAGLCTLTAAILMSVYSIITRKLASRVRPHVMQLFASVVGIMISIPFAIWVWQPISLPVFGVILWVGVTTWAGHEMLTRAHKYAQASVLMPYSYSFIIYMSAAGYFLYDELPDIFTILGALVVVAAGLLIWHRERSRIANRAATV